MTTSTFEASLNTQASVANAVFARVQAWFAKLSTNPSASWADGSRGM